MVQPRITPILEQAGRTKKTKRYSKKTHSKNKKNCGHQKYLNSLLLLGSLTRYPPKFTKSRY